MLSEHDFWGQVERLQAAFGERHFLEGRMAALYDAIKALSAGEFSGIVSHLIDESAFPPTPAKIKEACRPSVDRAEQQARSIAAEKYKSSGNRHWCEFCGNTGVLTAVMRGNVYEA